jgi:hypothetical protein
VLLSVDVQTNYDNLVHPVGVILFTILSFFPNIDIKPNAHDVFLEQPPPPPGTTKAKILKSQMT